MSTLELPALYVDSVALVVSTPRLVVVNRDPSPGETGVPVDATLALELVDTGADGVNRASHTHVWVDGVLAFDGGALPEIAAAFAGPLAGATQTADTLRVVLHPVVPMASLATVSVRVLGRRWAVPPPSTRCTRSSSRTGRRRGSSERRRSRRRPFASPSTSPSCSRAARASS
jgi:hypothetical protein